MLPFNYTVSFIREIKMLQVAFTIHRKIGSRRHKKLQTQKLKESKKKKKGKHKSITVD